MALDRDEHEALKQDFEREMSRKQLEEQFNCCISAREAEAHNKLRASAGVAKKAIEAFTLSAPLSVAPGYEPLQRTLQHALDQAQYGKGKERHATGATPFIQQPICEIGRMVGIGYNLGQAMKKSQEAARLPNERARAELLGAINYLAAAYLLLDEQDQGAEKTPASAI